MSKRDRMSIHICQRAFANSSMLPRQKSGQCLIFILDNALDISVVEDCDQYRRDKVQVQLLVMTRDPITYMDYMDAQMELSTFTTKEGRAYVTQCLQYYEKMCCDKDQLGRDVEKITALVCYTPLKLELATGYLQANRGLTISNYILLPIHPSTNRCTLPEVELGLKGLEPLSQPHPFDIVESWMCHFVPTELLNKLSLEMLLTSSSFKKSSSRWSSSLLVTDV